MAAAIPAELSATAAGNAVIDNAEPQQQQKDDAPTGVTAEAELDYDSLDDIYDDDDDDETPSSGPAGQEGDNKVGPRPKANVSASLDDQFSSLVRHAPAVTMNVYGGSGSSGLKGELRKKDKADRATKDQVMDNRTKAVLLKLANAGRFYDFYDVPLSTGKEANVYHAVRYPPLPEVVEAAAAASSSATLQHNISHPTAYAVDQLDRTKPTYLAVKIYKTRILAFRDRDKYVQGEWRFQSGYHKGNNLSMVKVWAEKEFRNLNRLVGAGIPAPHPELLRSHVLLMSFVGDGTTGEHAPKLRDIDWSIPGFLRAGETGEEKMAEVYLTILSFIRVMFQTCRLVHGDLSEYNILYHDHLPWIIDVSQSTEHTHPHSLEMLRTDIKNINSFFRRTGVTTLPDRLVYQFVTVEGEDGVERLIINQGLSPDVVSAAKSLIVSSSTSGPVSGTESTPESSSSTSTSLPPTTLFHRSILSSLITHRTALGEAGTLTSDPTDVDDAVFRQQYIPQTLEQVYDFERDGVEVAAGRVLDLPYAHLLAAGQNEASVSNGPAPITTSNGPIDPTESNPEQDQDETDEESESDESDESEGESGDEKREWVDKPVKPPRGKKFQDKDDKKAHKVQVKVDKADKRKVKMAKSEKKKLVKSGSKRK